MRKNTKKPKNKRSKRSYKLSRNLYTTLERASYTFLSPHKYLTLRYSDIQTIVLTTGLGTSQVYNLNSLFDPDRTGTGHQPYGFDQISPLYNRYRPLRTRWRICFSPSSLTYALAVMPMNGLLATSVTNQATYITAAESPRSQQWEQGSSGQSHIMAGAIALNELNGVTKTEYLADDRFEAQVSTSPAEVMILEIALLNPNGSTITVNFCIDLFYEVDFHDPIILGGS